MLRFTPTGVGTALYPPLSDIGFFGFTPTGVGDGLFKSRSRIVVIRFTPTGVGTAGRAVQTDLFC